MKDTIFSSPEFTARIDALLKQYPTKQSALLEVLWLIQSELGYLSKDNISYAAGICECSPAHAYGVATFYTMYKHAPTGRFFLQFCQNVCCHISGAESIISLAEKKLGIKSGETTADNLFTIVRVECLGACGNGPVMLVNDDFATDVIDNALVMEQGVGLNEERLDKIIDWCKNRAKSLPSEPKRDPLGGATGAIHGEMLPIDFAPPPPALGVKATVVDDKVNIVWKIAPEVSALAIEKNNKGNWELIATPSVKDKDFTDVNGKSGDEYRIIAKSLERVAKPALVKAG